jgi:glycosidase
VLKVEPPHWWVGHSLDPVRLLIRGRGLAGAAISATTSGVRIGATSVNAAGTYLLVDVHVAGDATPGAAPLGLATSGGAASAPFELLERLPRPGRFAGFSPDDVIYLIMPDRFANGDPRNDDPPRSRGLLDRGKARYYHGGDLQGVIGRLPYLKDLGVTTLWLTPWYDNNDRLNERETYDGQPITDYHGYGAVDFYGVEEHLGDLAALRRLVEAAHALGLKVIQDQVANHTGPYHPWVQDPPTQTWLSGTAAKHLANKWQTWTLADPHATGQTRRETLEGWFIDILPDINHDDPEAARYVIQNSLWWVGTLGLDGIRQDTLPYVPRRFWSDWTAALKREHPQLTLVGELFDGDPALVSFFQGGVGRADGIDTGLDTLFDFPLLFPLRRAFAEGKPLREVAMMLGRDHLYPDASRLVTILGLHDVPRFMQEPGATLAGLKLAFTLLLTSRGTPLIYYGDEIGMPGGSDPDNRRDFPGGWPDDPRNAFEQSGRTPEQESVFQHVRGLLHLRAELPALRRGAQWNLVVDDQTWAFARVAEASSIVAMLNNGAADATIDCPLGPAGLVDGAVLEDRLRVSTPVTVAGGRVRVRLPPRSAALFVPMAGSRAAP